LAWFVLPVRAPVTRRRRRRRRQAPSRAAAHWRAQVLRKAPTTAAGIWDETRDRVASELRGSTLIERYIDPNATDIPDYATATDPEPLSRFYKWRVVAENYFQP
jgi:hypothetical protein